MESGYGCCPYENATCCSDLASCCPSGYTCDVDAGTCNASTKNGFFSYIQMAKVHKPKQEEKVEDDCPTTDPCGTGETCCPMESGYGCCPYENATCCSDLASCCPSGYTCDVDAGTCNASTKNGFLSYIQMAKVHKLKQEEKVEDETCPSGTCAAGTTCCSLADGSWGCCPYPNATCCTDQQHCCPNGYTCDLTKGQCVQSTKNSFMAFVQLITTPKVSDISSCIQAVEAVYGDVTSFIDKYNQGDIQGAISVLLQLKDDAAKLETACDLGKLKASDIGSCINAIEGVVSDVENLVSLYNKGDIAGFGKALLQFVSDAETAYNTCSASFKH